MNRVRAAAYLARALDPDELADLDAARTEIRARVARWLLTLSPVDGPDGARLAALHHVLPAWVAAGCPGRVPDGVAVEWAARAGVRPQSAAQTLAGVRRLNGQLRDVLPIPDLRLYPPEDPEDRWDLGSLSDSAG